MATASWYAANKQRVRENNAAYYVAHREHLKARQADRRAAAWRKREEIAARPRPDSCEVCDDSTQVICFDHDHQSGLFRGWICHRCNSALGLAKDSAEILRKLASYLERGAR